MGADQLVRIGIVDKNIAARAGNRHRVDGVGGYPESPGQLHCAVLIGVFETDVQNRRRLAPVQPLFELFFGYSLNGHGAILAMPSPQVKVSMPSDAVDPPRGAKTAHEPGAAEGA